MHLCASPSLDTEGGERFGIDIENESITDTYDSFVWEPLLVKRNAIAAASEATCLILSIDETIKAKQNEKPNAANYAPARQRGRRR